MPTDEWDDRLVAAEQKFWQARVALYSAVVVARAEGVTWQEIADVLGVSRQAVQERFTRGQPERSGGRQAPIPAMPIPLW